MINREKTIVRGLTVLMGLMGLMGLAVSCSNDEEPALRQAEAPVAEVRSFATYFDEYVAKTRAWTFSTDGYITYTSYEDGVQPIGIAFTQDGQKAIKGTFYKNGDKWRLIVTDPERSVDEITAGDYYLYGYIPSTSGIILNVTDRSDIDGDGAVYRTGAKVELTNVPTVMTKDLCVVIGAKDGTGKETVTGLRRGDFKYTATAISKTSGGADNNVFLLFDHLYASLRINMRVKEEYAALRTIKLKALKLCTKAGETTSKENTIITVGLQANDGSTSPITGITYEQTGNVIGEDGLTFWWSDAGEALTTAFTARAGHFMPHNITTLVLTSVYDVYDRENNLIRENCSATNTMVLEDLLTEETKTQRGRRYTVNMTIWPTYLYVLSEPDLDSPTVTVE